MFPTQSRRQAIKSVPHAARVQTVGCRELDRSIAFADQHGEDPNLDRWFVTSTVVLQGLLFVVTARLFSLPTAHFTLNTFSCCVSVHLSDEVLQRRGVRVSRIAPLAIVSCILFLGSGPY